IYKTGDLARWRQDGNIEFLGRMDHQIKIRGFRVEPGEIENHLLNHEDIKKAVVIAREDAETETYLCAYIVSAKELTVLALREYLSRKLPAYMIPAHFFQVKEIPLTPGGKVNRQALLASGAVLATGKEYVSPASDIEKTIAGIWQELLEVDRVSIHDNFFDMGGNSFSLVRLNHRIKEALKIDIPIVTLFNYPTIALLAGYISRGCSPAGADQPVEKERGLKQVKDLEIAVIGMACRFPGAGNTREFWKNLKNGVESIAFRNKEELREIALDPGIIDNPNYVPAKGILEDKNNFDAWFFGYTPAEAEIMDPQIRIFHECCWEALEDAGYDPETYEGTISLYAGATPNPYWEILPLKSAFASGGSFWETGMEKWEAVQFSGKDFLSTRIAYKLNLKGPCVALQTACSTSLAAVDLACQALVSGKCDIVLAGGVSITFLDDAGYLYQEGAVTSIDGHCRAFAAQARGTIGGDGAGVVVLKRLEEAARDNDNIYAVIKGFAINNDGKVKAGFTAPSVEGQARVIREAWQRAGVKPESIGYVEAHGTGTLLGDPIEIEGLKQAFKTQGSSKKNYCAVGSVKTNIGHLDVAAGIAGLIKAVLALKHQLIPPSLHFEGANPRFDLENSPFYVNNRLSPWKNNGFPLRAGVSSFGLGGTNAHVILEEAPKPVIGENRIERQYQLILLSAKTESALDRMTKNLAEYLGQDPGIKLADAAYTLQVGRKAFPHRRMLVGPANDIKAVIHALECGEVETGAASDERPTVVFMFSGQGSQFVNMGLDLYETEPVFRSRVDHCFKLLEDITGMAMKSVLYPGDTGKALEEAREKIHQFPYPQP
ncbi:MAG: acyltransferase domain-containing protein, partial [Candidatus Aminicenantes bacterium]